jgi:hypothetical protein
LVHIQAAQASKKKVRTSECTLRLYKKYSTNGRVKTVSTNVKINVKSYVMHIGKNGMKGRIGRNRKEEKERNDKVTNKENNKKTYNKVEKYIKDIRVKSTYKSPSMQIRIRYTSKPVLVRTKGTVSTECIQREKCTQTVSNTRETSDEGWKMYSIEFSVAKIGQNGALKYKIKVRYTRTVLIRSSCVVYTREPKSVVKGRLANGLHSVWQWKVVSVVLGHGYTPRSKNMYIGLSREVRVSNIINVIFQRVERVEIISVKKMNPTGKGERGGTMDVDGLLAGGSQGKNISIVITVNITPKCVIFLSSIVIFYAYVYSLKYEPLVLLSSNIYVRLKPYKYHCNAVASRIWNTYLSDTDIVSQNRMYKTVLQAFIEWGGRYGE